MCIRTCSCACCLLQKRVKKEIVTMFASDVIHISTSGHSLSKSPNILGCIVHILLLLEKVEICTTQISFLSASRSLASSSHSLTHSPIFTPTDQRLWKHIRTNTNTNTNTNNITQYLHKMLINHNSVDNIRVCKLLDRHLLARAFLSFCRTSRSERTPSCGAASDENNLFVA